MAEVLKPRPRISHRTKKTRHVRRTLATQYSSVGRRGSTVVSINISKDAPIDVGVSRLLLSTRATGGK